MMVKCVTEEMRVKLCDGRDEGWWKNSANVIGNVMFRIHSVNESSFS